MTTAPPGHVPRWGRCTSRTHHNAFTTRARHATIARMSDITPARKWRPTRMQKTVVLVVLFLAWTMMANSWADKGCTLPQGYAFVISHGGSPDRDQGCESEPGGPEYTDQYYG